MTRFKLIAAKTALATLAFALPFLSGCAHATRPPEPPLVLLEHFTFIGPSWSLAIASSGHVEMCLRPEGEGPDAPRSICRTDQLSSVAVTQLRDRLTEQWHPFFSLPTELRPEPKYFNDVDFIAITATLPNRTHSATLLQPGQLPPSAEAQRFLQIWWELLEIALVTKPHGF
ncbi:hypothetical protein BAC2_02711 [uncultured bacterium]|nr:hypothetical protein BAC2_02711 [uncultured bacterium]